MRASTTINNRIANLFIILICVKPTKAYANEEGVGAAIVKSGIPWTAWATET